MYLLHEHPVGAGSWQEAMVKRLMSRHGVQRVVGYQCQFGLKSKDDDGAVPARKRTGFLTNAVCIARRLNKKCPNTNVYQVHRHETLTDGRTRAAHVYPDKWCREICLGMQEQKQKYRDGQYVLANVQNNDYTTSEELTNEANKLRKRYQTVEEEDEDNNEEVWDDV